MKTLASRKPPVLCGAALVALLNLPAFGTPYYWDGNDGDGGFGTAAGTWAAPTTGTATSGWSLDSTGATVVNGNSVTTATADALNFGTASAGLGAGSISVSGAVSANSITFGSASGAATLADGTSITLGGTTPTITVNNTSDSISTSVISSPGLTKNGSGELILSGTANSITGTVNSTANPLGIRVQAGTLTVSGGTTTVASHLGSFSTDAGVFNQTGGTVTLGATSDLIAGWNSFPGTFTLSGGFLTAGNIRHQDSGAGTVTISGTSAVTAGSVYNNTAGIGTDSLTVNLDGGTLTTSRMYVNATGSGGSHALNINLNGGTLKASATGNLIDAPTGSNAANASVNATVKAGGAIFDTNGFEATIRQPLLHDPGLGATPDGGLTKNGTGTLILAGTGNTYTGATTINGGTLRIAGSASPVTIGNHSFETPTTTSFTANPSGGSWTFNANSGVAKTIWFSTSPLDGVQAGYIQQAVGTISQTVSVGTDGYYRISFLAEGRGGSFGPEGVIVQVDGAPVGTWTAAEVSQSQWLSYSAAVNLTAGNHTLTFLGNNTLGGDKSVAIDNVQMALPVGSLPSTSDVNLATSGATLDLNFANQTIGSLTGVAGTSVTRGSLSVGAAGASTSFAGVFASEGSLTKTGAGALTLSGSNTHSGGTTLKGGQLNINNASALGTGIFALNTAASTLDNTSGSAVTLSTNNAQTWSANFTFLGSNDLNLGTGAVTMVTGRTVTVSAGTLTVGGAIGESGGARSLTKAGTGTLALTASNTYSGATHVNQGALVITGATQATSAITVGASGTLGLDTASPVTASGAAVTLGGSVLVTGSTGASSYTLLTASSITGTPVLASSIPGYTLQVVGNELRLVQSGGGNYAAWQGVNGAGANLDDDHDNDGVPNGVEYFLGGPSGNTTGFTALPGVTNTAGTLSVTWTKGSGYAGTYGTHFWVETSTSLTGTWTPETLGGGNIMDNSGSLKFTFPNPLGTKQFARLRVTGP